MWEYPLSTPATQPRADVGHLEVDASYRCKPVVACSTMAVSTMGGYDAMLGETNHVRPDQIIECPSCNNDLRSVHLFGFA